MQSNGVPLRVSNTGATISVVFDMSQNLNNNNDRSDYLAQGIAAAEAFLQEAVEMSTSEVQMRLFVPEPNGGVTQIPVGGDFTIEVNIITNYLWTAPKDRQERLLFNVVNDAVEATAERAYERGSQSVLLLVGNGAEEVREPDLTEIMTRTQQSGMRVVSFGVGPEDMFFNDDRTLTPEGFRLRRPADATSGQFYINPSPDEAGQAAIDHVATEPAGVYMLTYRSGLFDDGKEHVVSLKVGEVESDPARLPRPVITPCQVPPCADGDNVSDKTLFEALFFPYIVLAIAFVMLVPGLIVGALTLVKR